MVQLLFCFLSFTEPHMLNIKEKKFLREFCACQNFVMDVEVAHSLALGVICSNSPPGFFVHVITQMLLGGHCATHTGRAGFMALSFIALHR